MADPFLAEIRMFGFNFAPRGWARCDGALLPISQNQALFSLLGTIYGGDGRTTFQRPDLRGRTPIGFADDYPQGLQEGAENVAMTVANLPPHRHDVNCSTTESVSRIPTNQYPAQVSSAFSVNAYHAFDNSTTFATAEILRDLRVWRGFGRVHGDQQPSPRGATTLVSGAWLRAFFGPSL